MKKYSKIFFTIAFTFLIVATLKAQSSNVKLDFESNTIGDQIDHIGWYTTDIQSVVADDPVSSGNNVLKNTVHNYNAAPVLMFVLPSGKTLADYDSLSFKGYFQKGDVGYKDIIAQAYQTKPTGHFLDTDTLGIISRAKGASTAWENITLDISNSSTFTDTIYIAMGISCAGTSGTDTTTWYADDVELVAKSGSSTPSTILSWNFDSNTLGDAIDHIGWYSTDIQSVVADDPVTPGNNVLKNTVHNYNAAPVLMFVLPSGKTLADYDSLTFKGYFQKGDVGYKTILAQAYQTKPTGHFLDTDTLGLVERSKGASTDWENITLDISNTFTFSDTVYIAFGISCAGTSGTDTTTWYADDINLVAKSITPPPPPPPPTTSSPVVTNGGFEDSSVGDITTSGTKGWFLQVAAGSAKFEIEDTDVEEGNNALKATITDVGANAWDIQAVADSIPVQVNGVYQVSIWAKAEKQGQKINLTVGNYSYSQLAAQTLTLNTQWKRYSLQFQITSDLGYVRIPIHFSEATNKGYSVYLDNVNVIDVNASKKPIIVEAESGTLGSNFLVKNENTTDYVTAKNNNTLYVPGDSSRVATYQVTFPDSGHYNLFARVRVGSGNFNDDSFFYGHGFGVKNDTLGTDWTFINGLGKCRI